MKKAFITKGIIFDCMDAATIVANGQTITEATVSDYATLFETSIEIEVNSDEEIILTVHPVNCDLEIDFCDLAYTGECEFSRIWNKIDEYYECEVELNFEIKLSDKLEAKIIDKVLASHDDDDLEPDPDMYRD